MLKKREILKNFKWGPWELKRVKYIIETKQKNDHCGPGKTLCFLPVEATAGQGRHSFLLLDKHSVDAAPGVVWWNSTAMFSPRWIQTTHPTSSQPEENGTHMEGPNGLSVPMSYLDTWWFRKRDNDAGRFGGGISDLPVSLPVAFLASFLGPSPINTEKCWHCSIKYSAKIEFST